MSVRALILDCETLPVDAEEHRTHLAERGLMWPNPPLHALGEVELAEPKPAPASFVGERKAQREAENARAAAAANIGTALDWWRGGSLRPERARVYCVSMTAGEDVTTLTGTEADICEGLDEVLVRLQPSYLVAWNAPFDAAHLRAMAWRAGPRWAELADVMTMPHYSFVAQLRGHIQWRGPTWLDAMQGWGAGRASLASACSVVGVDHLDRDANPIDGAGVLDAYMAGREADILRHCEADVRDLWRVWEAICRSRRIEVWRAELTPDLETPCN